MSFLLGSLNTNGTIIAAANLGGVIALMILAFKASIFIYRSIRTTWSQSLSAVIIERKRIYHLRVKHGARDIHTYIGQIYYGTSLTGLCIVYMLLPISSVNQTESWSVMQINSIKLVEFFKFAFGILSIVSMLRTATFVNAVLGYRLKAKREALESERTTVQLGASAEK